ncbi:MAG: DegT/DnrJ/EryC1/StrS family aminotransferase [Arsenophonus sp. NC-PG7-MAG3]
MPRYIIPSAQGDLNVLRKIAQRKNIALIEDPYHAAGTQYKSEWISQQDTRFSFHAIKISLSLRK